MPCDQEAGNVYNDGENLALEDSGYVQMDGNYDHNDDPPQQPLSPVIGADMPQFDEGHLEAVMSFQVRTSLERNLLTVESHVVYARGQ